MLQQSHSEILNVNFQTLPDRRILLLAVFGHSGINSKHVTLCTSDINSEPSVRNHKASSNRKQYETRRSCFSQSVYKGMLCIQIFCATASNILVMHSLADVYTVNRGRRQNGRSGFLSALPFLTLAQHKTSPNINMIQRFHAILSGKTK